MTPRLKALSTLQQIESRALQSLSRALSEAQGARAASEARIQALGERAAREARVSSPEALPYLGRFMATLRREQGREQATCQQLSGKIDGLRDQVMQHYTAGRSWEMLSERLQEEIATERARRAEAQLEDMTSARFRHQG
ncbi:hypothetical protein [Pseudogemmobacter faecipullorum]|uniref:Flagellar FliJ protein n=1 Tax=Pseudogemmobacter faecipullorum TaxID=2755041 RepID=A0ABS8CNC6_9RHOB|nr:hypothetical protein [Pseudogemmobacter faecipullorum]MCB5410874.1 hypothetical protein [Pseudogemmobacter faecipullorum]